MNVIITKIDGNKITFDSKEGDGKVVELASWVKLEYVELGNAEITIEDGKISYVTMQIPIDESKQTTEKPKETTEKSTEKKYIVNIKGKDFMTYEGLLAKAHEKGKDKFSMTIIEKFVSDDMNKAWCMVRLTAGKQTFDGFGSSTPENTGTMTKEHPIEMAHTRAKGRALRDYLNIGQTMYEEIKQDK